MAFDSYITECRRSLSAQCLRANPSKTQVCASTSATVKLNVNWRWSGLEQHIEHCETNVSRSHSPPHTLIQDPHWEDKEQSLFTKQHFKLTGSRCGAWSDTLRSTALALCYSSAEYACPVCMVVDQLMPRWTQHLTHAVDLSLNASEQHQRRVSTPGAGSLFTVVACYYRPRCTPTGDQHARSWASDHSLVPDLGLTYSEYTFRRTPSRVRD